MINTRSWWVGALTAAVAVGGFLAAPAAVTGQTINGTLMEVETDQPISLGLVIMMTEAGDSVTSGVTDGQGRFAVTASEPGSFYLIASAFGFKETTAGVFELGAGGEMDVEFRVAPAPMPIDGLLVSLQRPVLEHNLVRNGYVRRLTRGLGVFLTPAELESHPGRSTADLFRGIPNVRLTFLPGGLGSASFQGEALRLTGVGQMCTPTIYLDGARMAVDQTQNMPLDLIAPRETIEAIEIYRRPAEVPIEYGMTATGSVGGGPCGVVVIWTKSR